MRSYVFCLLKESIGLGSKGSLALGKRCCEFAVVLEGIRRNMANV